MAPYLQYVRTARLATMEPTDTGTLTLRLCEIFASLRETSFRDEFPAEAQRSRKAAKNVQVGTTPNLRITPVTTPCTSTLDTNSGAIASFAGCSRNPDSSR